MIQIGTHVILLSDPLFWLGLVGLGVVVLILVLLVMAVRAAGRSAQMAAPLAAQLGQLGQRVQSLSDGQQQLAGGLRHVSDAQAAAQTHMLPRMERRLAQVNEAMTDNLQ